MVVSFVKRGYLIFYKCILVLKSQQKLDKILYVSIVNRGGVTTLPLF